MKCRNIDLLKLKDINIWHQLMELTSMSGMARDHFAHIQYINRSGKSRPEYWYDIAKIRCVFINKRIIAWGLVIKQEVWETRRLWLYTDKEYRCKGIQKKYVLPYFKRYYPNCNFQSQYIKQKETFKYYYER